MKEGNADPYQDFSSFYDLYVGSWIEDLPFYLEHAMASSGPLLEIGAGSGRLTIPFAEAGFDVTAVDVSSSMLAILQARLSTKTEDVRRRAHVVLSDCRQLDLETEHTVVIMPFYTFNYLLTREDQDEAIRRISRHVTHQGHVLIDLFIPWTRIDDCPTHPVLRVDSLDPKTGVRVRGWNVYRMDTRNQFEYRTHVFEITTPDRATTKKEFITQRHYAFPDQLEEVFSQTGFHIEDVFGGYKKESPQPRSEQLLYVLKKE